MFFFCLLFPGVLVEGWKGPQPRWLERDGHKIKDERKNASKKALFLTYTFFDCCCFPWRFRSPKQSLFDSLRYLCLYYFLLDFLMKLFLKLKGREWVERSRERELAACVSFIQPLSQLTLRLRERISFAFWFLCDCRKGSQLFFSIFPPTLRFIFLSFALFADCKKPEEKANSL